MNQLAKRNKQIIDFNNSTAFKALDSYYSQPSIFSALGVSRHENTHSNFLAWLFTPKPEKNDHGLGDFPLRKLLETLALACALPHSIGKIEPSIAGTIVSGGYTLTSISVEREKHISAGRLDIYVEGKIIIANNEYPIRIAVENKVKSSEHDAQTGRYLEALRRPASAPEILLCVYLTPLNNRDYESLVAPQCDAREFIQLNYQYLADYVITPCRDRAQQPSITKYLDEYLLALGLPETRQDKGDVVMAISKEERDLLATFWEAHKDLLTAAILSIDEYVPLEDDEKEIISKASRAIENAIQRDYTRYTWAFADEGGISLPKGRLVLEVIKHYAIANPSLTLAELSAIFPKKLQGSLSVVVALRDANPEYFKGHKRYYIDEPIILSDGPVAVCTQWRADNILTFIKCVEGLGYVVDSTQ